MAIGKNKRISKKGKGGKKKQVDALDRKEWYDIKAPSYFKTRKIGHTIASKTQGTKIASDSLKGRIFDVSLADLNSTEDAAYRKIFLRCDEVSGSSCLTNFHGMDFTRDRLCSLFRKWQTLIEAHVDVKTTDGYTLRIFSMAFTDKAKGQVSRASYAQSSKVKKIRKTMVDVMTDAASSLDLKQLVEKFIPEQISKEIEKKCKNIFPLRNVYIRKVKVLKSPPFDITKLMELHGEGKGEDMGKTVGKSDESVPGAIPEATTAAVIPGAD